MDKSTNTTYGLYTFIYGRYAKNNGKTDESLKNSLLKIKEFLGKYDEAVLDAMGLKWEGEKIVEV